MHKRSTFDKAVAAYAEITAGRSRKDVALKFGCNVHTISRWGTMVQESMMKDSKALTVPERRPSRRQPKKKGLFPAYPPEDDTEEEQSPTEE